MLTRLRSLLFTPGNRLDRVPKALAAGATTPEGRQALAVSSDALLEHFDRLTADYERSLQVLMA